jgi:hypothetical protein
VRPDQGKGRGRGEGGKRRDEEGTEIKKMSPCKIDFSVTGYGFPGEAKQKIRHGSSTCAQKGKA